MAQVVFVQPESAVGTRFNHRPDFRPKMREAGAVLKERGKQMIFLTATPGIRYSVFEYEAEMEQSDAVSRLIRQKLQEYPSLAKIIIYSSSIHTIKELGKQLGYPMYYAEVGTRVKQLKVAQFISGMSCQRIYLDYKLDDRSDRAQCEEGDEVCDVCSEDNQKATNTEALQRAYNAEQQKASQQGQERVWDSGVEIPSSFPVVSMASSPPPRHPVLLSSPEATYPVAPSSPRLATPTEVVCVPTSSSVSIDKSMGSSPSKCSTASTASFDCGFSTEISTIDRLEYESQQRQHQASQAHTQANIQGESQDVYELEQQLEG
ncbi:hypothetical protein V502_02000, partial [Pseudogymnoascus sp. VKM F-4520 (FW-2644)]